MKSLRFYTACKLISYSPMLTGNPRLLGQRQSSTSFILTSAPLPPGPTGTTKSSLVDAACPVSLQWICIIAKKPRSGDTPIFYKAFICKPTQPLPQRKISSLLSWAANKSSLCSGGVRGRGKEDRNTIFSKVVFHINILKKIVPNKSWLKT